MKNILTPIAIISAGNMAGNITSSVVQMQMVDDIALQFDWTGSPVGSIAVQVSLNYSVDPGGAVLNPGTWATLPSSAFTGTYPVPGTTTTPGYLEVPLSSSIAMRVVYTASSGTGSLTVLAAGKGV
jgi:hypothetical protein